MNTMIKIGILKKGDSVLNVWENNIAVKKKNGDVEIYRIDFDKENLPRLSEDTILITQGDGSISARADDNSVEVTTF